MTTCLCSFPSIPGYLYHGSVCCRLASGMILSPNVDDRLAGWLVGVCDD